MRPLIALAITDKETNAQIKNLGVGLLELRADLFKTIDPVYILAQIKRRKDLKIPLLLTLRNDPKEGARRAFSDAKKREIIRAALPLVDMIDVELRSPLVREVLGLAGKLGKKTIVSSHFLSRAPKDLEAVFQRSAKTKADYIKIAAKANSSDDVMRMLAFTHRHHKDKIITICLGPLGAISRLVLPCAGSQFTYAFLDQPTASGQVDVKTLQSHFKVYYK